jgi:hypothetical protein
MRHEARSRDSIGVLGAGTTVKTTKAISEDLSLLTVHREISNQYRLAIIVGSSSLSSGGFLDVTRQE